MTKKKTTKKSKPETDSYTETSVWVSKPKQPLSAFYTDERIVDLEKNSSMLGQIANVVFDFCVGEETTLQGVIRAVATLRDLQARELWDLWEKESK
jgi:hypothetical protein